MKRKAFVLIEILTGMMLQATFAITLCGAFYLILTFSTSTQQILASHDEGQIVISYINSRIRNAGLGLWDCRDTNGGVKAETIFPTIDALDDLPLPVAIMHSTNPAVYTDDRVSFDDDTKIYSGNVLTLLYAHKDTKQDRLIVLTNPAQTNVDASYDKPVSLSLIEPSNTASFLRGGNSNFVPSQGSTKIQNNIKGYAVMESAGRPVLLRDTDYDEKHERFYATSTTDVTISPLSELLNIECQKMYTRKDSNGNNFIFAPLEDNGASWRPYYHTKGILELYMTLDTKANPPIFDLKVLVSEGKSDELTAKPANWPATYWYETATNDHDDFRTHRVHVAQASWKLYNLAPLYHD